MGKGSHGDHGAQADAWTKITAALNLPIDYINGAYWIATLVDLVFDCEPKQFNLSFYGIGVGLAISAVTSVGSMYAHYKLNTHMQDNTKKNVGKQEETPGKNYTPAKENVGLTFSQKAAILCDLLNDTGYYAGGVALFANLLNSHPSRTEKIITQAVGTFFGALQAYPDARNCRKAMLKQNKLQQSNGETKKLIHEQIQKQEGYVTFSKFLSNNNV